MFAYRLARDLGVWDVEGMLSGMSASDLSEWMAFYILDASDQDPEVTKWDTKETAAAKQRQKALRGVR